MVIDDKKRPSMRCDSFFQRSYSMERVCIHNDYRTGFTDPNQLRRALIEDLDLIVRVYPRQIPRRMVRSEREYALSFLFQKLRQGQLRTDSVAVWADVRDDDERIVPQELIDKQFKHWLSCDPQSNRVTTNGLQIGSIPPRCISISAQGFIDYPAVVRCEPHEQPG